MTPGLDTEASIQKFTDEFDRIFQVSQEGENDVTGDGETPSSDGEIPNTDDTEVSVVHDTIQLCKNC